uniref:BRICHOS domain containing 5 n=1 Tax=Apteryx owenii TaxID=8824 RepID=A0A8B9P6N5_APTOW
IIFQGCPKLVLLRLELALPVAGYFRQAARASEVSGDVEAGTRGQPAQPMAGAALAVCAQPVSQVVRLTLQGRQDPPRNQSAFVDKSRSTVTYYVTSQSNRSAVVLYDGKNVSGYVCYKPAEQRACYLRRMDSRDLQDVQTSLNPLLQNNQTKYYREFLGVLAGKQADPSSLGEAVQNLCEQTSIFWVRRGEGELDRPAGLLKASPHHVSVLARSAGPGRQRLIYLCIDICFPSNICVSICFYYLPE